MRPLSLAPAAVLAAAKPHGTRIRYVGGCRCLPCRAANSRYETERAAQRRMGLGNGLVPAKRARRHLSALSAKGVGRRAVAEASGVSATILMLVKSGRRTQIRSDTERRILAVNTGCASDGALISAQSTWRLIDRLLDEGFSRKELARRLGYRSGLQLNRARITVRNAGRVRRFYDRIMAI